MLAALRSRCSSLPSLFTLPPSPSLLDQSWKLGFSAPNRFFASSPSSSSPTYDISEVLTVPEVEKILADVKADNVTVIPTKNQCYWADFAIIATGRSDWHLRNIAQALVYRVLHFENSWFRLSNFVIRCFNLRSAHWFVHSRRLSKSRKEPNK